MWQKFNGRTITDNKSSILHAQIGCMRPSGMAAVGGLGLQVAVGSEGSTHVGQVWPKRCSPLPDGRFGRESGK